MAELDRRDRLQHRFYAATALDAAIAGTPNYAALVTALGWLYNAHSLLMLLGGSLLGCSVLRRHQFPAWTGSLLLASLALSLLLNLANAPDSAQLVANLFRNLAWFGLGIAVLRSPVLARSSEPREPAN